MGETQAKGRIAKALRIAAACLFLFLLVVLGFLGLIWSSLQPPSIRVPPQGVILSDVTIVNPGMERRHVKLLSVRGSTIENISDQTGDPEDSIANAGDSRYAGDYVLPGLIDMHVHYPTRFDREFYSLLYLKYGVTTVREMGNVDNSIFDTRRMITEGKFPGPRIFTGGKIIDGFPPLWPGSIIIRSPAEAETAVANLAAAGADFIKVYSNLSPDSLTAIKKAASYYSLPVVGHPPFVVPLEKAGIQDIQHLLGVWPDPYWNRWGKIENDRINNIVQISLEQRISHTPTIVLWDRLSKAYDPYIQESNLARIMPRYYRQLLWNPETGLQIVRNVPPKEFDELAELIPTMEHIVGRLHDAGVRIHPGTDTIMPYVVPGTSLHEELNHLNRAGFTTEEVWIAATRDSGDSLGEPMLGTIQVGAPADLLIFSEDPTLNLNALRSLRAVIAQGRLYTMEELDEAYDRHRRHFEGFIYDRVSMAICRRMLKAGSGQQK